MTNPMETGAVEWSLPLATGHPAGHGGLRLQLHTQAGQVISAKPLTGRLHRGAEKLFESRDYRSILALANRHDWLSAFGSELGLAQLLERMLGISVPIRARWLRVLLSELSRVGHHLLWLGATLRELGEPEAAAAALASRERTLAALEAYSGARMHLMVVQIGGLRADADSAWLTEVGALAASLEPTFDDVRLALDRSRARTAGVGVVPKEVALTHSASGPVARAAGIPFDLRLDRADEVYQVLASEGVLTRVTRSDGDALARLEVLLDQARVSAACVSRCASELTATSAPGPIAIALPKVVRVPEGHGYGWTENPTGINGWYLISRGEAMPYRLKLRTASFNNAATLPAALAGATLEELPIVMMTYLLVAGDLDK